MKFALINVDGSGWRQLTIYLLQVFMLRFHQTEARLFLLAERQGIPRSMNWISALEKSNN
jgi:hypothetical protein